MRHSPRHAVQRAVTALSWPKRAAIVSLMAAFALLGAFTMGGVSSAAVSQSTAGEAGVEVVHWNNWHIRDAHAEFQITSAMMTLNSSLNSSYPGATGVELCDDDDNVAAQLGVTYLDGQFEVLGAYGDLTASTTGLDPCSQDGVIVTRNTSHAALRDGAAVQLAGADGITSGVNDLTDPVVPHTYVFPGNEVQPAVDRTPLAVGDTVVLDAYYNPTGTGLGGRIHDIQFTVDIYNTSGVFVKELQYIEQVKAENFYEAAIGVQNSNAPQLTAPADLPLVNFELATFNNYNGSISNRLEGGEMLNTVQTINGASQVTLTPGAITGNSFPVLEGSASS